MVMMLLEVEKGMCKCDCVVVVERMLLWRDAQGSLAPSYNKMLQVNVSSRSHER
jgi:hypothetical protein